MSFAHLSTVGTLKYNGYTFDGSSQVSVKVEFVPDEAERTVLYSRHTISVQTFVNDNSGTDSTIEAIRAALSHQGKELIFINHGFGNDLIVNSAGGAGLRDVKWGPKPRILSWNPVGSSQTCEVVWECEVCVPKCSANVNGRSTGVMAINYAVSIAVDERGLSSRTVSGYLEIAQTRGPGSTVPDSADNYRHLIQPPQPDNFKRTSAWGFSLDKSRIEFTITDTEIPSKNAWPILVTHIEGSHRCSWSRGSQYKTQIRNTISLDIETSRNAPPQTAWQIFGQIVKQRVEFAQRDQKSVWLDEVMADEDIFGLKNSFSCSYRILMTPDQAVNANGQAGGAQLSNLFDFAKAGLWEPIGTDWRLWKTSLATVFNNRGLAGLSVPAQTDVIIDLCETGLSIPWSGTVQPSQSRIGFLTGTFENKVPSKERSYLKYRMHFIIINGRPSIRQSPMQQSDTDNATGNMLESEPMRFNTSSQSGSLGNTPIAPDVIQQSGPGRYSLSVLGSARRAGYPIPRPRIASVGGQTPVERDAQYHMEQLGVSFGVPVYEAAWRVDYELPSAPSVVTPPVTLEGN